MLRDSVGVKTVYEVEHLRVGQLATLPEPRCPDCGTKLLAVDSEQLYPVVKGDSERRVFLVESHYCRTCMVGCDVLDVPYLVEPLTDGRVRVIDRDSRRFVDCGEADVGRALAILERQERMESKE